MATQDELRKHPASSGILPPPPEQPLGHEDDGSYGPSPVPESPSWSQLSASIAPTAQPAPESPHTHAVRATTIATSFILGVLVTAALGVIVFATHTEPQIRNAAAPDTPMPVAAAPARLENASPAVDSPAIFHRPSSGTLAAFDMAEAQEALGESQLRALQCARPGVSEGIDVQVIFSAMGRAASVSIPERDRLDEKLASCVQASFLDAVVSPFEGREVALTRRVVMAR